MGNLLYKAALKVALSDAEFDSLKSLTGSRVVRHEDPRLLHLTDYWMFSSQGPSQGQIIVDTDNNHRVRIAPVYGPSGGVTGYTVRGVTAYQITISVEHRILIVTIRHIGVTVCSHTEHHNRSSRTDDELKFRARMLVEDFFKSIQVFDPENPLLYWKA
jgi:hypothetical protein